MNQSLEDLYSGQGGFLRGGGRTQWSLSSQPTPLPPWLGRDENGLANGTTSISGHQIRYSVLKCICAVLCLLAQSCPTLATPWTVAHQASLSMGIFQEKYTGEGCHALFQGTFPTQGSNPGLLHCRHTLYHLSHQGREMYLVL